MIAKKVYADRVLIKSKVGNRYITCVVTKYILFGFITLYTKYVEI